MPSHFDQALVSQMPTIRAIGRARLTNAGELEDFVQETLLRAYTRREQLADAEQLPQWVHAIARNTATNWNRDRKYLPILTDAVADSVDSGEDACARMEAEERFRALRSALMALAPRDREMLVAHVVDGVAYRELRSRYGLSGSAVGVRLHRAKRRMRRRLGTMFGAVACGVGLSARQAVGATMMTARWKTAVLVGVAVGGTVAIGVWQGMRPEHHPSPISDPAESPTVTGASSTRQGRVAASPETSARRAARADAQSVDRQEPHEPAGRAAVAPIVTASPAPQPKAVDEPTPANAQDAEESVVSGGASNGALAGIVPDAVVVSDLADVVEGEVTQVLLSDGNTLAFTRVNGELRPVLGEGITVSYETVESE